MDDSIIEAARKLFCFHSSKRCIDGTDSIVAFGSYDSRVAEYAAKRFKQTGCKVLICSGKEGNWTRGKLDTSEAAWFGSIALKLGVQDTFIYIEDKATNISENIIYSVAIAKELGRKSISFITKPQTILRVWATASNMQLDIKWFVDSPEFSFDHEVSFNKNLNRFFSEMVGDLVRMQIYPKLGYQVEISIPDEVNSANKLLIREGFIDHLPSQYVFKEKERINFRVNNIS